MKKVFLLAVIELIGTNLELANVLLDEVRKELDQLWGKYEIALYSLEVLNIKYKKECLANVSVDSKSFRKI